MNKQERNIFCFSLFIANDSAMAGNGASLSFVQPSLASVLLSKGADVSSVRYLALGSGKERGRRKCPPRVEATPPLLFLSLILVYNILMAETKTKKGTPLFEQKNREVKKIRAMTLLTTQEAAERLRLRRETILEYIRAGKIKAIQFNRRIYRIQEKELEKFIKKCQRK